ncbi:M3 family oligoendopeptidase [Sanyastnella coralliicola]|uniref:M3 family oligoendopeptidase n=1 Tax=Sanyastnella coralliicola TaxID=3069118 RepID=UPI0027B93826|nr:M3 family oligoendopeptidase [Longitalea sp. SCSIO 12813]
MVVEKKPRRFIAEDKEINSWDDLKPIYDELVARELPFLDDLRQWLADLSEFEAFLEENVAWRYIRMTIDTTDEAASNRYKEFVTEIQPHMAPYSDQLNKKIAQHPMADQLDGEAFRIYLRGINRSIELFREENIPLQTKAQELAQEYGGVSGAMTIDWEGETLTMQQAGQKLQSTDRELREKVFKTMQERRLTDVDKIEGIFDELVKLRHEMATNAGFENYRDFKFAAMGRFDYTPQDCFNFHDSIENALMPIATSIVEKRRTAIGLDKLRPWDLSVDTEGRAPLKPFNTAEELIDGSIEIFEKTDPFFGDCLRTMKDMKYLDLASKQGKAPGGYNYPLYESGIPFIFMNAVGTTRDLVTMMHEGGHAVHSVLTHPIELTSFKGCPSEVAELASMSMELISLDHWNVFFTDNDELVRAKREHLEDILSMLPWIAMIDAFQHWIYTNPEHTREERKAAWMDLETRFGFDAIDWSGMEEGRHYRWHRQLHLFEVPFYYIEYGMAQLGAIAVWRNYKEDPTKALNQFKAALELGYTRTIGDIYATAGIKFDFSVDYIKELAAFVQGELAKLA